MCSCSIKEHDINSNGNKDSDDDGDIVGDHGGDDDKWMSSRADDGKGEEWWYLNFVKEKILPMYIVW